MVKNREYQLGLYEKAMPKELSWHDKLCFTKEAGFDYLEMSIDETDEKLARLDWNYLERLALKQAVWDTGVAINSICLSGHRRFPLGSHDDQKRQKALKIMEQAINLAKDLGVRIIQLAGYDVYYENSDDLTKRYFLTNLQIAVEMAAKNGIMLGFETMETPFMDTVGKAMTYVEKINNPYLGIYPDIGNLKNASLLYGDSVHDDLVKGKGHIMAAHLKETTPGHYREIPFGTGHTAFVSNIMTLKSLGVRLFVGEFWYVGSLTWQEDLKAANNFLRQKLDQVFVEGESCNEK
ncbi:MAG: L-ribulose-5-phosphate 3-epimerase [Erysipelotrichaceae bacterium]|nr:L-ribulose-5-phosphate 3-epimerase [Erysipelotrichaceae bacterium]MDY5252905.1 L-ribulose-5-phosphate 3-epimerase [Erysipelotrichaceae bacterium]